MSFAAKATLECCLGGLPQDIVRIVVGCSAEWLQPVEAKNEAILVPLQTRRFSREIDNVGLVGNSQPMRTVILVFSFLPFVYYGAKDTAFHFRGRKVSRTEHILHGAIGLVLAILFAHALMAHHLIVVCALLIFVVAGSLDEYIFHRDIPAEESDLHAKEHFALLIFIAVSLATDWLGQGKWSWAELWQRLGGGSGGAA